MAKKKSRSVQSQVIQDDAASPLGTRVRQLAVGAGLLAPQAVVAVAFPTFALVAASVELAVPVAILLTALYARESAGERAFHLLRMVLNRPEPPAQQ
ncbi:hypothetical protein ACFVW1_31565 [Streptomyces olivochromogenes]|uniref:hypothetical protein n=1 Tax=Streptomyces TaxID=1883 RepID=UPI002E2A95B5|nr:hypothetical protein [Streptomyces sp. NBC_00271]